MKLVEATFLRVGLFRDLVEEVFETGRVINSQLRWSTNVVLCRELPLIALLVDDWSQLILRLKRNDAPSTTIPHVEGENEKTNVGTPKKQFRRHINRAQLLEIIGLLRLGAAPVTFRVRYRKSDTLPNRSKRHVHREEKRLMELAKKKLERRPQFKSTKYFRVVRSSAKKQNAAMAYALSVPAEKVKADLTTQE